MKITKEFLAGKGACREGIKWFLSQKETSGLKLVKKLMAEKKLDWANWLIVRLMKYEQYVSYAVFSAEQVIGIFEQKYPNDKRPRRAIKAAKRCIESPTQKNKDAAADAAAAAASAADAAAAAAAAAYTASDAAASAADAAYAGYVSAASATYVIAAYAASAAAAAVYTSYAAAAASAAAAAYTASDAAASAADAAYAASAAAAAAYAERLKMKLKILNYGIKLLEAKR